MNQLQLATILDQLLAGQLSRSAALEQLAEQNKTCDLGDVQLDTDRHRRCGFPEVVYGEGKSIDTLRRVLARLMEAGNEALATRISPAVAAELHHIFPQANYHDQARTFRLPPPGFIAPTKVGRVAIVTAGTTDLPIAYEARETLDWMGVETDVIADVGVAGPHRLPAQLHRIVGSDAVVVVAGMEAALPSVVAGYVDCPVIGVPTSVGYGANFGGLAAVLSMINSCAANVVVVNIDAGFKGGYVAGMIARRSHSS